MRQRWMMQRKEHANEQGGILVELGALTATIGILGVSMLYPAIQTVGVYGLSHLQDVDALNLYTMAATDINPDGTFMMNPGAPVTERARVKAQSTQNGNDDALCVHFIESIGSAPFQTFDYDPDLAAGCNVIPSECYDLGRISFSGRGIHAFSACVVGYPPPPALPVPKYVYSYRLDDPADIVAHQGVVP